MDQFNEIIDSIYQDIKQIEKVYAAPEIIPHRWMTRFQAVKTDNRIYISFYIATIIHLEQKKSYKSAFEIYGVNDHSIDAALYYAKQKVNKFIDNMKIQTS